MSDYAITTYYNDLENAIHYGGFTKETAIRFGFQKLLEKYAETKDLKLIPEISTKNKQGKIITPDGTLKDQYKEKKPKDPTIAEKFNTYKFADYKEKVVDLLGRVCRVSVGTVGEMGDEKYPVK